MKKGFKKASVTILIVLIAGFLFTGCGINYIFSSGNGSRTLNKADAKEYEIKKEAVDPITSIVIDTRIADVEIIESDNYYVDIDYLYWDEAPVYTLENGKLTFDDSHSLPDSYSINFNLDNIIRIYLPKAAALDRMTIDSSAGNVTLEGFTADNLRTTVSYGNFKMKNAAAVKADITLSCGKSEISDFQTGEFDFRNSYGNADFTNINTGDEGLSSDVAYDSININMSSGNASIDGMQSKSVDVENSYGNITCKGITADSFDARLSSGKLDVSKADLRESDVRNSYGDVILSLLGAEEDYSLDLNTSYGNVSVEGKSYDDHYVLDNDGSRNVTANLSSGDVKVSFQKQ